MRVAVVCGGRSSEHDVSLQLGAVGARGRARRPGTRCSTCWIARSGAWQHDGATLALEPGGGLLGADAVFPVLHGPFGEDGTVQGLLELLDVPYVGAGVLASSLCMDKVVFKEVLAAAGVPQVGYAAVRQARVADRARRACASELAALGLPLFVKPARLGSSVGIVKVTEAEEIDGGAGDRVRPRRARDRRGVLATGWRSSAPCSGSASPRPRCPGEIVLTGADWYDYDAKYEPGGMELVGARADPGRRCRGGAAAWRARRSCAWAAPAWRASTSSSRASACSSTSSTRCPASPQTSVVSRSCGRPAACRSRSCATGCCDSRSSASAPSAAATRSDACPQAGLRREERDLGDLDALGARRRAR